MTLAKESQFDYDGFNLRTEELFNDDQYEVRPKWYREPEEPLPTKPPAATPLPAGKHEAEPLPVAPQETEADQMLAFDSNYLDEDGMLGEVMFQVGDEGGQPLSFMLPLVPGGMDQSDIEEPAEIEVEEEEDSITVEEQSPWKWQTCDFLKWLSGMMQGVPQHSGKDSVGLERAISYLEAIDREISKAVRSDLNNEIDISEVESARDELYNGLTRLQDRLEKVMTTKYPKKRKKSTKKKKADENHDMVKEAKSTHVGGIIVTVPLFISHVARTCINSMVSAGKDIEDCFDKLAKKFDFTPREEAETMQLLADMGYPMRRPRGYHRDEEIDYTSTDNFDWQANYPG